ncbi:DUF6009 family protein [Streptomyces cyaneofuscatus]
MPAGLYRAGAPGAAVDPRTIRPGQVGGETALRTGEERRADPTDAGQP